MKYMLGFVMAILLGAGIGLLISPTLEPEFVGFSPNHFGLLLWGFVLVVCGCMFAFIVHEQQK